jgi:mRNA interferase MazF
MGMPDPGDVVTTDFPGATGTKRRPAVVISSSGYHREHRDLILGVLTTNTGVATTAADYILKDWRAAGLQQPSAFRSYFAMAMPSQVRVIGRLSEEDWSAVKACVGRAIALDE